MTVKRVMGSETEYGISSRGGQYENHASLSFDVISAVHHMHPQTRHIRWNYGHEDPVNDARGYHLPRAHVHSDLLTDREELRSTNVVQYNGGRVYVDHAHPEYSSPEVFTPQDAVKYSLAGDVLMQRAVEESPVPLTLYRNNTDGKGASWGSHENYQVLRSVPFDDLAQLFTAHAITRQIYTGTGRVGIGIKSECEGFQISQRADFFTTKVGLQTTFDRPIVNTRDESHSTELFRRFHVIVGDANRMNIPELLEFGTTSILFWALEQCVERNIDYREFFTTISCSDPVSCLHRVSHDLSLKENLELVNREEITAFALQLRLRTWVYSVAAQVYSTDSRGEPLWPDKETQEVMQLWGQVLVLLAHISQADDDERLTMADAAHNIEWFFKWQILESMRRRRKTEWSDSLLKAMDISWGRLDGSSLWNKVKSQSERIISRSEVEQAIENPPESTRAFTRGMLVKKYPEHISSVSWDIVTIMKDPNNAQENPLIVSLENPEKHTAIDMRDTFAVQRTIEDVISHLV